MVGGLRHWSLGLSAAAIVIGGVLALRSARHDAIARASRPESQIGATLAAADRFGAGPTVDPRARLEDELPRRILALHDSSESVGEEDDHGVELERPIDAEVSLAHKLAELPLNHLGLAVDHLDVDKGELPSEDEMGRYRGVLLWFGDDRVRRPDELLEWLAREAGAGRRIVVMEHLGAFEDLDGHPADPALLERTFGALGGRYLGQFTDDSSVIALVRADPEMVGFERKLPGRLDVYQQVRAASGTHVYVQIERTDLADSTSDAVWTGPSGGFVLPTFAYAEDRLGERYVTRWIIDPFRFFEEAFDVGGWLRPDFTTRNGRRIFYSQIDGDGMEQLSELDFRSRCGAIVRDEILAAYELPFTASVVVGYTAPPPIGLGTQIDVDVARSIFARDNVEVGSHGLAHPMDWRGGATAELSVPDLPGYTLSGESEIAQSVAYIDAELAPPGKPCTIMLWTGWCNPNEAELAVAYRLGLRNLNGGDPRMDEHYPSYAHLVAPVHAVGRLYQFQTSAANDYILTDGWVPPYYRFRNVVRTFEQAGAPRRVVPIDVYFHFYIARNLAGLTGLREVLDWVVAQPIAPMFTSEYVDVARDFQWARIARRGDRWTVRKGGALRTLRADGLIDVDVERSRGVLGYLQDRALGVTYVHLDGSGEVAVEVGHAPPRRAYLAEASHPVDALVVDGATISFETHGPGNRTFVFAGLAPGVAYRVNGGARVVTDGDGRLPLDLGAGRAERERVRVVASP